MPCSRLPGASSPDLVFALAHTRPRHACVCLTQQATVPHSTSKHGPDANYACLQRAINHLLRVRLYNYLRTQSILSIYQCHNITAMAAKEATVYILDLGRSMSEKRHGRDQTDLDWALEYVWDKITTTVSRRSFGDLVR